MHNLSPSTTYEWEVRSICNNGNDKSRFDNFAKDVFTTSSFSFQDGGSALLKVSPNPSTGISYITAQGMLYIYDYFGNLLIEADHPQTQSFNFLSWNKGVYFIRVVADNGETTTTRFLLY